MKTSDNGKGVSPGNYTIEGAVDRYDFNNNTLADATSLAGASQWDATATQAGDKQDFYDLADWQGLSLDVDQGGSVKLTFYDANNNVVKVSGALNGKTSLNSAFVVKGATGDLVEFQAFDLAVASFIKIEAVGVANNHYQLAVA